MQLITVTDSNLDNHFLAIKDIIEKSDYVDFPVKTGDRRWFLQSLENHDIYALVDNGNVIGVCLLGDSIYMALAKSAIGLGLGSKLLIDSMMEHGIDNVQGQIFSNNKTAIKFADKYGKWISKQGRIHSYEFNLSDLLEMSNDPGTIATDILAVDEEYYDTFDYYEGTYCTGVDGLVYV